MAEGGPAEQTEQAQIKAVQQDVIWTGLGELAEQLDPIRLRVVCRRERLVRRSTF